ncbi:MAG: hypothetical protein FWE13_01785 [Firmicutes bacterium]|nr:hypothetical protein [Bacillota bacterium]
MADFLTKKRSHIGTPKNQNHLTTVKTNEQNCIGKMPYLGCDNIAMYRILTKPGGLTYNDICFMTDCSKTWATKIINNIHEKIAKTPGSKRPVKGRVSRQSFCEYMKWDFDEIQSFAFAEIAAVERLNSIHNLKGGCVENANI